MGSALGPKASDYLLFNPWRADMIRCEMQLWVVSGGQVDQYASTATGRTAKRMPGSGLFDRSGGRLPAVAELQLYWRLHRGGLVRVALGNVIR